MNVIAVNASCRPQGTTVKLTNEALEGAASKGAETSTILLRDYNIKWCNNCLKCYNDLESDLAPCSIDDDMTALLQKILEADGIIFASPVHNGHLTAQMVLFFERMVWRICRPTGEFAGLKSLPQPRTSKVHILASIMSVGGIPAKLRRFCDPTPHLKENACLFLNGYWVGDMYAESQLKKMPESKEEWSKLYNIRQLSQTQLKQARRLGESMAEAILRGRVSVKPAMGGISATVMGLVTRFMTLYRTVEEVDR